MRFAVRYLQALQLLGLAGCCGGPAHWVGCRQVALQVAGEALHIAA